MAVVTFDPHVIDLHHRARQIYRSPLRRCRGPLIEHDRQTIIRDRDKARSIVNIGEFRCRPETGVVKARRRCDDRRLVGLYPQTDSRITYPAVREVFRKPTTGVWFNLLRPKWHEIRDIKRRRRGINRHAPAFGVRCDTATGMNVLIRQAQVDRPDIDGKWRKRHPHHRRGRVNRLRLVKHAIWVQGDIAQAELAFERLWPSPFVPIAQERLARGGHGAPLCIQFRTIKRHPTL